LLLNKLKEFKYQPFKQIIKEFETIKDLKHENIIQFIDFDLEEGDNVDTNFIININFICEI
jgi:chemotaxis signal transduction protein